MPQIQQVLDQRHHKLLLAGVPKGGGKTTFAMTAPQPIACLMYDLGNPVIPPGVNPEGIYVRTYPSPELRINPDSSSWEAPTSVGKLMLKDLIELRAAVIGQREVKLDGEPTPWPCPRTIVLDGAVAMSDTIIDWILGVNRIREPGDYGGGGDGTMKFWGKRLQTLKQLYGLILPLPVNVVIITWTAPLWREERDGKGRPTRIATDKTEPDLGGKLDVQGPGKVDSALLCYSEVVNHGGKAETHYYIRTKPNANAAWVGVRNAYNLPDVIDVTMRPDGSGVRPWERLWGKEG